MAFQKMPYLELWRLSCSVEHNHLCNFERGRHGEKYVKSYDIWTSGSGGDVI